MGYFYTFVAKKKLGHCIPKTTENLHALREVNNYHANNLTLINMQNKTSDTQQLKT
jgi:hypothetical protein